MASSLNHRGPDEAGMYIDDTIGIVNTRLSIIDLAGGSQPIHNSDENLWIVYNGEVFNYPELKADLVADGYPFYTDTDTEVILALYEREGARCLDKLNGQFAFAIWDSTKQELFLARDRVGINPLHYTCQNGRFVFGSEIKAILSAPDVTTELDSVSLDQIFTFWTTLPGRTAFRYIQELEPGHYLKIRDGQIQKRQYWEIPFVSDEKKTTADPEKLADSLHELLRDATRIRLRADVPVGTYLSGGLDSSGITSMVSGYFSNDLETFGIEFQEKDYDERLEQRELAGYLGVHHNAIEIRNNMVAEALPEVIRHTEKPVLRTAPVPLYLLSQLVHENNFKVVLTGEGADEIFGGYNIYKENKIRRFWAREPESKIRYRLLETLYPYVFRDRRTARMMRLFFGKDLQDVQNPWYSHALRWRNASQNKYYFSDSLQTQLSDYDCYEGLQEHIPDEFQQRDDFSKAQYFEMAMFMSNYLLSSQGDRMAMGHSVEIRVPYLDHRVIEFMASVPAKWKIRGLNEKYLLKKMYSDLLPDSIRQRSKNPYRAPITSELVDSVEQDPAFLSYLDSGVHFDEGRIRDLFQKIRNSQVPSEIDNMALVGILTTFYVFHQFVEGHYRTPERQLEFNNVFDHRQAVSAGAG